MVARKTPRRILVIDVGGTHVKLRIDGRGPIEEFVSGPKMTPRRMTRQVRKLLKRSTYDAVSIGYPGVVYGGKIVHEPRHLGRGWVGYNFTRAFGKPVKLLNDAAMQALGSYRGGRMLFLGLGTGLGVAFVIDGIVEPTEIGHLPYKRGLTFEDYLGERGREKRGNKNWRRAVRQVTRYLGKAFEPDYVVLGGGNAKRLRKLPHGVLLGDNRNAFIGGLRLWRRREARFMSPLAATPRRG